MKGVRPATGQTGTVDATVGTCGPFWDVLRAMDLSNPGDLIDIRSREIEEVAKYAHLLVRAAGGRTTAGEGRGWSSSLGDTKSQVRNPRDRREIFDAPCVPAEPVGRNGNVCGTTGGETREDGA